jgi:hypothetical protein
MPELRRRRHKVVVQKNKKPASHNSALTAKVEMRRWLVGELSKHLHRAPAVLDCFCAAGMLWDKAYGKTPNYLGLDVRQFDDERRTIVTDSRRFLRHADVKLGEFDIFDLDAFGSPLEHLAIICDRLRLPHGRRIGVLLTDGTGFNSKMNGTPKGLLHYVGIEPHKGTKVQASQRDVIFRLAVAKALATAGLKPIETRRAAKESGGSEMRYAALLLESERE